MQTCEHEDTFNATHLKASIVLWFPRPWFTDSKMQFHPRKLLMPFSLQTANLWPMLDTSGACPAVNKFHAICLQRFVEPRGRGRKQRLDPSFCSCNSGIQEDVTLCKNNGIQSRESCIHAIKSSLSLFFCYLMLHTSYKQFYTYTVVCPSVLPLYNSCQFQPQSRQN